MLNSKEVIAWGQSRLYDEAEYAKNATDRIRATVELLRLNGAFVSKSEIKHIHAVDTTSLTSMIEQMRDRFRIDNKPPAQLPEADADSKEVIDAEFETTKD